MGLGKTVMVLALIAGMKRTAPVLVVVPRSLVFNWKQEAARFAPKLRVLDHTGSQRDRTGAAFADYDIVLTTYGILRLDAELIASHRFDTCILDVNLTSAGYVFLLDPWWNPAAEAQAIDRTHRIGQTVPVFAYRLIAKDTVEEKVLALQATKRALADAILGGDSGPITDLKREDLELLLS